ncbi:MAG: 2-phosphosulfolactate phosphatase [Lachnospiraceae bacterium]|nr:2-phosphosulfolactate phosphatase [Lachnospiraceae bacterium]
MEINIYHLIEGAKKAKGEVVIIDVFRAFSLECYLYSFGVRKIRPVGTVKEAFEWRKRDKDCVLVGERGGRKCDGFDFGNSPSGVDRDMIRDKLIIHTTSAGTQGIINAQKADEIITGSLVNASAIARYIRAKNPKEVSLVCMGTAGKVKNLEDELCANYIKSMLSDERTFDIGERIKDLRLNGGQHFFDPNNQEVFPQKDFYMCIERDIFDFVIRIDKDEYGYVANRIFVEGLSR